MIGDKAGSRTISWYEDDILRVVVGADQTASWEIARRGEVLEALDQSSACGAVVLGHRQ